MAGNGGIGILPHEDDDKMEQEGGLVEGGLFLVEEEEAFVVEEGKEALVVEEGEEALVVEEG
jgi:hypothetical protein